MIATFLRYNVVQVLAYICDFGVFWTLATVVSLNALVANVCGKAAAGALAFLLHKRYTFRAHGRDDIRNEALRYFALLLLNIPLSSLALWLLLFVLPDVQAKLASDAVLLGITFLLVRATVFRKNVRET